MILAALPLSRFVLGLLCYGSRRAARLFAAVGWCTAAALTVYLLLATRDGSTIAVGLGGWPADLGIVLRFDAVSAAFCPLLLFLELAVLLYVRRDDHPPMFYALLQFLLGAVFALFLAQDLFNEYVILELLTLVSFLLVGYSRRPMQIWASLKYLVLASIGMSFFLVGVAVVYQHAGTLNLGLLAEILAERPDAPWVVLATTLLAGGVAVKAGLFTFSLWLPSAHAAAPSAISALLSGLVIKMGIVVLIRLSQVFPLGLVLQVLGATTALLGVFYAAYAADLKRMLAFSTLSQIGYLVLGLAIGTPAALAGVLDYAIAHGLFKALLFLAAGDAVRAVGSGRFADLTARRERIPRATVGALLVGTLGIVGLPPLSGFGAKAVLFSCQPSPFTTAVFALTSIGTAFAFAKLLPLFRVRGRVSTSKGCILSYAVLALPILFFIPLTTAIFPALRLGTGIRPLLVLESVGAIAVGGALRWLTRRRTLRLPGGVFHLEEATLSVLLGVLLVYVLLRI